MIKIDVEGVAGFIFANAAKVLSQMRPKLLIESRGPQEKTALDVAMREHGYRAFDSYGKHIESVVQSWHSTIICRPK